MGGGGGGGGGGRRRGGRDSLGDIRALEKKAKEALRQSQTAKKNVFISFAYEDVNEVNLLRGQAANENSDIEFRDYSVSEPYDSDRAEYIRQKLTERINQTSTTVVYLSEHTSGSRWVKWEVDKSRELGKRVIAVHKGKAPQKLPGWIKDYGIDVVSWSNLSKKL